MCSSRDRESCSGDGAIADQRSALRRFVPPGGLGLDLRRLMRLRSGCGCPLNVRFDSPGQPTGAALLHHNSIRLSVLFAPSGPVPTTAPRRPRPPYLRQEEFRTASDSDPRQCRRGDYYDGGAPSCRGPCRRGGSVTMNMRIATACATLKGTKTRDHPLSQRVRRIGPLAPGGSVRVLRARVPVAALAVPAGRSLLRRSDKGRRGGGPPPPAEGPQAPGGPPTSSPPRPVIHGRVEQGPPPSTVVVVVPGHTPDAPSLAPRAGAEEVDVRPEVGWRQATDPR